MSSEAYLDVVGEVDRGGWPPAYNACIDRACTRCGALAYQICVNPVSGHTAKAPCLARNHTN